MDRASQSTHRSRGGLGRYWTPSPTTWTLTSPAWSPTTRTPEREKRVYEQLAAQYRDVATRLCALGEEMAGCQDLPMGAHDLGALSSQPVTDALARMIRAETDLLALLTQQLEQHRVILSAPNRHGSEE